MQAGIGRQFQLGLLRVVEDPLPRQLLGGINALRQRGRAMLKEASGQGSRQQFVLAGGKGVGDGVDQQCTAMSLYVLSDRPKQNPICFRKWGFGI